MRTSFIVNPAAGRGKTAKIWPELAKLLQARGFKYEAYFTTRKGEATELAGDLSAACDCLVVAGGDGTFHEVVQAVAGKETILSILPTGTGNDLVRTLGIPRNPAKALEVLFAGRAQHVDLGQVNGHYFVNVAGVGFDAEVAWAVNTNYKHIPGTAAYLLALFQLMGSYRNVPVRVRVDKASYEGKAFLVAVGNGCYYGGGMKIVPEAIIDDGYLHVCLVGDVSKLETLQTLPKIFSGQHTSHPKVQILQGKEIVIEAEERMTLHADGEIVGQAPAVFTLMHKGLKILLPEV